MQSIFSQTTVPILEQVLNFTEARHNILAGNIANMDTPGYQVRDLSVETFHEQLKEALQARETHSEPFSPGFGPANKTDPIRQVRDSLKSILFHDDTNVSMEHQVAEMSKNQFMHNTAVSIMTNQFRLMQATISERV